MLEAVTMELAQTSTIAPVVALPTPPRIGGVPLLGALPEMLREHHGALDRWFRDGGDFFEVLLGGVKVKCIARGRLAAEAMIANRSKFVRSPIFNEGVKVLVGNSVLTREGQEWVERRRALQPQFQARVMRQMVGRIGSTLDEVLDGLEPGRVDVSVLCDQLTMAVGLQVMFGHELAPEIFEELSELAPIVIQRVGVCWITSKLPKWLPLPGEARFRRALARLDEIVLGMVEARRSAGDFGDDLLGTLLHMTDEGVLDDRGVRDEAVTMLLAGYETTSNTLGWTLHTLAEHPEVCAKIRDEANAVLADGRGDVRKLEYSLRAFKEGLRLHPAALFVMRQAVEDAQVGVYTVAEGETILISTHLVHRNPKDWEDPDRFDPDRFLETPADHAFIPFGVGHQMCIGKHLALIEGQLVLAKLLQRFALIPVTDHTPQKRVSTTLGNADGIYVELDPVD